MMMMSGTMLPSPFPTGISEDGGGSSVDGGGGGGGASVSTSIAVPKGTSSLKSFPD